mmetsp:Transcript_94216/g.162926  ORF Transcript_94216/g.162926 Transcript_94216/m.162926 type:complete len:89 (+) Transcript_94216:1111-1377(+)
MSNGPTHHGPAHAGSTGLECHSNKNAIHDITESIPNHDGQHHGIQWAAPCSWYPGNKRLMNHSMAMPVKKPPIMKEPNHAACCDSSEY